MMNYIMVSISNCAQVTIVDRCLKNNLIGNFSNFSEDLYLAFETCGFELAYKNFSPWCNLFSEENMKVILKNLHNSILKKKSQLLPFTPGGFALNCKFTVIKFLSQKNFPIFFQTFYKITLHPVQIFFTFSLNFSQHLSVFCKFF